MLSTEVASPLGVLLGVDSSRLAPKQLGQAMQQLVMSTKIGTSTTTHPDLPSRITCIVFITALNVLFQKLFEC